jgi:SagB-type dehydrogenase family enzyme
MLHRGKEGPEVKLPPPGERGEMSLEETISRRRSVREYKGEPLSFSQLSQVLWAAQGLTDSRGLRAAPSAGATYPLDVFIFIGRDGVEGLEPGIYHYDVANHSLSLHKEGDQRRVLSIAALDQEFIAQAPVDLVICATLERTSRYYGRRAERYVHMEVGHAGENVSLQAVALGLVTVMIGAFDDEKVSAAMDLAKEVKPLYIIPLGKKRCRNR